MLDDEAKHDTIGALLWQDLRLLPYERTTYLSLKFLEEQCHMESVKQSCWVSTTAALMLCEIRYCVGQRTIVGNNMSTSWAPNLLLVSRAVLQ